MKSVLLIYIHTIIFCIIESMDCYVGDIEELPYILVSQIESKQVIIITNDTSHISPTQVSIHLFTI